MKIERVALGTLHVIESVDERTVRFESFDPDPNLQFLATMTEQIAEDRGYDVRRYARAKITLVIEAEGLPDYMQRL
jgi:hypothetical protein